MADTRSTDAWVPTKKGETLSGEVTEVGKVWSDYRLGFYPLVTIKDDDGTIWRFHAFRTVANNLVLEKRPLPGERIVITYEGARKPKPTDIGNPPVIYRIEMPGRPPESVGAIYDSIEGQTPKPIVAVEPEDEPF
jgi:hypothetical protein